MSNLRSATKALELLGADVRVVGEPAGVEGADAVVLPGVGHFGEAMRRIRARGLDGAIRAAADEGVPVLGICLGLQLLFEESEESPGAAGIGLLPGLGAAPSHRPQAAAHRMERGPLGPGHAAGPRGRPRRPIRPTTSCTPTPASPRTSAWCWGAPPTGPSSARPRAARACWACSSTPRSRASPGLGLLSPLDRRGARRGRLPLVITLYPAIDLQGGQAVRLRQGDFDQ